jgi:hypothetical protein
MIFHSLFVVRLFNSERPKDRGAFLALPRACDKASSRKLVGSFGVTKTFCSQARSLQFRTMNQTGTATTVQPDGAGEEDYTKEKGDAEALWDTDAFETHKPGQWKESKQQTKNVSRLQDLSLNSSDHDRSAEKNDKKEESWPYDSSPCRMYGGKNTRPGGEEMNKELFKSDWAKDKNDPDYEFAGESDDFDEEAVHDTALAIVEESEEEGEAKPSPSRSTRKPRKERPDAQAEVVRAPGRGEADGNTGGDAPKKRSEGPPSRSIRRASSSRDFKKSSSKSDGLGTSCHGSIETSERKQVKKSRHKDTEETTAGDSNGPVSFSRSGPPSRVPPRRTRTGDGLEDLSRHRANTRDEMIGEPAEPRKSSRRSKPKPDRRSLMSRAMSTANVKKPEDYGPQRTSSRGGEELGASSAHSSLSKRTSDRGGDELASGSSHTSSRKTSGRRRMLIQRSASQRSLSKEEKPRSSKSRASSDSEESEPEFAEDMKDATPSEPAKERKTSRRRGATRPTEPRRDLLILLREQKTVTQKDLTDKENRRLLHFLIYEHKMGVSLTELEKSVRKEKEDGIEPDRRQRLYIET